MSDITSEIKKRRTFAIISHPGDKSMLVGLQVHYVFKDGPLARYDLPSYLFFG